VNARLGVAAFNVITLERAEEVVTGPAFRPLPAIAGRTRRDSVGDSKLARQG
jgi:hypothetical protein